jgi:hypothetical protein
VVPNYLTVLTYGEISHVLVLYEIDHNGGAVVDAALASLALLSWRGFESSTSWLAAIPLF